MLNWKSATLHLQQKINKKLPIDADSYGNVFGLFCFTVLRFSKKDYNVL
jgi:hypothetical protein